MMKKLLIVAIICIAVCANSQTHPDTKTLEPGSKAIDYNLKGVDGKKQEDLIF